MRQREQRKTSKLSLIIPLSDHKEKQILGILPQPVLKNIKSPTFLVRRDYI
jgi:hypothetical protein